MENTALAYFSVQLGRVHSSSGIRLCDTLDALLACLLPYHPILVSGPLRLPLILERVSFQLRQLHLLINKC